MSDIRPAPVAIKPTDLEYDCQILWEIFSHNKNSTLDYGWLRNRALRSNPKMTNDRQNAALEHLEAKDCIERVSRGRYRFKKPRPSAEVVANAPATPEEAAAVVPRFAGAMTDLVYSLLREKLPGSLSSAEIQASLGIDNIKDRNNMSASLQQLDKGGWLDVDRTNPRRQRYTARTVNKLGKEPPSLAHVRAPVALPTGNGVSYVSSSTATPPAQLEQQAPQARAFTLAEVKRYGELKAERDGLRMDIPSEMRSKVIRLLNVEAELRKVYGEDG